MLARLAVMGLSLAVAQPMGVHLAAGTGAPPPSSLACRNYTELNASLTALHGICVDQLGEIPSLFGQSPFPLSCYTDTCADVVYLVNRACGPMLRTNPFMGGTAYQLNQTVGLCRDVQAQKQLQRAGWGPTYEVTNRSLQRQPTALRSCEGRLVGRHAGPAWGWDNGVALAVPAGFTIELRFEAFWLPPRVSLHVYDGSDAGARELVVLSGKNLPPQSLNSTGEVLYVRMLTDRTAEGEVMPF
jgi:hypothetical protein|eukprot:COSAG01_NODE_3534_length_5961_cov_1047.081372_7_plen_243_part_00